MKVKERRANRTMVIHSHSGMPFSFLFPRCFSQAAYCPFSSHQERPRNGQKNRGEKMTAMHPHSLVVLHCLSCLSSSAGCGFVVRKAN